MAKFLSSLLVLALLACAFGAAAATADHGDLPQRQESMAELIRMSSDLASADPETMHRAGSFMRRELGPFGVVFNAIAKLPEKSAADVRRIKADAQEAAEELLVRNHLRLLLGNDKTMDACRQAGRCLSSSS